MTRSRRFFASSPWIATGTPDYVNLGYTSRGLAKQALMRLSRKSLAIFRKLGLDWPGEAASCGTAILGCAVFGHVPSLNFPKLIGRSPMKTPGEIIVHIATSADGYIARPDGDVA